MSETTVTRRTGQAKWVVAAVGIAVVSAAPGLAGGGSMWDFGGTEHRPGDIAEAVTTVAWSHHESLGTPEDGPYLLYLVRYDGEWATWPPDPQALPVGVVTVELGPFRAEDGEMYGPNGATARLEIPQVDPGEYQVVHCNVPCTTQLGDILGGLNLRVVEGSGGRSVEEIAADIDAWLATDRATPPPPVVGAASSPGLGSATIPVLAVVAVALLAFVSWLKVRRRPAALHLVVSEGVSPRTGEKTSA